MELSNSAMLFLSIVSVSLILISFGCPLPLLPRNTCSKDFDIIQFDAQRMKYVQLRTSFAKKLDLTLMLNVSGNWTQYTKFEKLQNKLLVTTEEPSKEARPMKPSDGTEFLCNWTYEVVPNSANAEMLYPTIPMEQRNAFRSKPDSGIWINKLFCQCRPLISEIKILKFKGCEEHEEKWSFEPARVAVGFVCVPIE